MSRQIVPQEVLTLGPFSLVGKWWVSGQPKVVVCVEMGTLEPCCQGSSYCGSTRARGSKVVMRWIIASPLHDL